MMVKKKASYLDEIGACREAIGYDDEQVGLDHEQEVALENNWGKDERDASHRAASIASKKKRIAKKLMRISRELEALGKMEESYQDGVEEILDDNDIEEMLDDDDIEDNDEQTSDSSYPANEKDTMALEMGTDDWLDPTGKEAKHPIDHDPNIDDPDAFAPTTMGDEWIDVGPGSFNDARDAIGKATK